MTETAVRGIARINDRMELGPDSQVDNKAMVLTPRSWDEHDPFLFLAEDWFSTRGFDWHPHRGIETVSYVIEGHLEHGDNTGTRGVLGAGDVQWMTAGRGIIHYEKAFERKPIHMLQLWVNLPAADKMTDPRYQDLPGDRMPLIVRSGVSVRVYSGRFGDEVGPAANHVPTTFAEVILEPGAEVTSTIDAGNQGFVYVLDGPVLVAGREVGAAQVAHLEPSPHQSSVMHLANTGDLPAKALVYLGQPLGEPVVAHGPFVMNTKDQIHEAYADYRAGKFGPIPTN